MLIHVYSASDYLKIASLNSLPRWNYNAVSVVKVWNDVDITDKGLFAQLVVEVTEEEIQWCDGCGDPEWSDDTITTFHDETMCSSCRDDYAHCQGCDRYFSSDAVTVVYDDAYCDRRCFGRYCSYCDHCEEYYHQDYGDDHCHEEEGCECDAPHRSFTFPANGKGTVSENEMLTVELPKGHIAPEGIKEIVQAILNHPATNHLRSELVRHQVESLDPTWQKKDGNFTRRLSKAFHDAARVKIPGDLLSEIGNIARRHTETTNSVCVQFTRDLNGSASDFYHEDSCWWQSYYESRCALKNWGGIGLRSYDDENSLSYNPTGRVWVQPLDADLRPTHDAVNAHAYVIYNGYGEMSGYSPARIVAHLTGRTYCRVQLSLHPQYVNGNFGYLVADEATCAATEEIDFQADAHKTNHSKEIVAA